jgi:hypothetical protein
VTGMDLFGVVFGILCAVSVLLIVAMPDHWFHTKGLKAKAGGPDYWSGHPVANETQSQSGKHLVVTVRPRRHRTGENQIGEQHIPMAETLSEAQAGF